MLTAGALTMVFGGAWFLAKCFTAGFVVGLLGTFIYYGTKLGFDEVKRRVLSR